jgi:hypothetical protein
MASVIPLSCAWALSASHSALVWQVRLGTIEPTSSSVRQIFFSFTAGLGGAASDGAGWARTAVPASSESEAVTAIIANFIQLGSYPHVPSPEWRQPILRRHQAARAQTIGEEIAADKPLCVQVFLNPQWKMAIVQ